MPTFIKSDQMPVAEQGDGWRLVRLAGAVEMGAPAMDAHRWSIAPGAGTPVRVHGDKEQMLYVIAGAGIVHVNGDELPLERETMLWLEPGDAYSFEAGPAGLEILQGAAPGESAERS